MPARPSLRPQRLNVTHLFQVAPDVGGAPALFIGGQLVLGAAGVQRLVRGFSRLHAGEHGVVRTLDAGEVDEACRAAKQRAAGKSQARHGLDASGRNRARAVAQPLAALERLANERMGLVALELVERRKCRVLVVEMDDEADRDQAVFIMIEERPAGRAASQRPTKSVQHLARPVLLGLDLPDFLDPDAEFLRPAFSVEPVFRDELLGERTARALRDQHVFAAQLHASRKTVLGLAVATDAHVPGRDADDRVVFVVKQFGGGEARIDLDAERLGLGPQPARHRAERAYEIAVIMHQLRHRPIRQRDAAGRTEHHEVVLRHGCGERPFRVLAPVRQQPIEADGVDDRAGQDMRADGRTLFDHDHRAVLVELLQTDRRREPCGPGPDDHDVVFHRFPGRKLGFFRHRDLRRPPSSACSEMRCDLLNCRAL